MMLTATQIAREKENLQLEQNGTPLMTADVARIMQLYLEMTNDPAFVPEDFSSFWPVLLGEATEQLNLDFFEQKNGLSVTRRGEVVVHPEIEWAAATLDGFVEE